MQASLVKSEVEACLLAHLHYAWSRVAATFDKPSSAEQLAENIAGIACLRGAAAAYAPDLEAPIAAVLRDTLTLFVVATGDLTATAIALLEDGERRHYERVPHPRGYVRPDLAGLRAALTRDGLL